MTTPRPLWIDRHRALLIGLAAILLVLGAIRQLRSPAFFPDPPPPAGPRSAELAGRIDPNTATWQALAALPAIGETRAKAIVTYRRQMHDHSPDVPAFRTPADLQNVPGIGPRTAEELAPWLEFPLD